MKIEANIDKNCCVVTGDVFSGSWSEGVNYSGVVEEWFGQRWWSTRPVLLFLTAILVLVPLASFRRVGTSVSSFHGINTE